MSTSSPVTLRTTLDLADAVKGAFPDERRVARASTNVAATISPDAYDARAFALAEIPGVAVLVNPAEGGKCDRCWQVLPEVGKSAKHPLLCLRCEAAVAAPSNRRHWHRPLPGVANCAEAAVDRRERRERAERRARRERRESRSSRSRSPAH